MKLGKSGEFIADIERQFEWYAVNANWDIAERYLAAVEAACRLVERYPRIGPLGGFAHERLRDWRFLVLFRPFQRHLLFYETNGEQVILRRASHGHRDLPWTLLKPPDAE